MTTTIAATATAPGRGAIAIIRVSGPKSLEAYRTLTRSGNLPKPNVIKPAWIYDNNSKIDQSMLVYFKAPNSFTGEDMLEIHCHGSQIVQNTITTLLNSAGIVPAKPGEFSERAYYNGKIDVTQAEAIMELVASENTRIARLATRQLAGEFSNKIAKIRNSLISLASAVSADLDFSEEDVPNISKSSVEKSLNTALDDIRKVQAGSEILPKLREGIHVALIGLPNAGKSTLLNSLLGYDRSIVTEVAGTTRDTISESVEIDGVNYHFTDTAGLNEKPDEVEKIGIEKTIETLKSADIILLLIEPGKSGETYDFIKSNDLAEHIEKNKTITVRTKSDLSAAPNGISISAKSGKGIDKLIKKIQSISDLKDQGSLQILTMRQINILARVEQSLVGLIDKLESLTNDIIGAELQVAIGDLNELTGDQASNQIIDSIFRNFCIGK